MREEGLAPGDETSGYIALQGSRSPALSSYSSLIKSLISYFSKSSVITSWHPVCSDLISEREVALEALVSRWVALLGSMV